MTRDDIIRMAREAELVVIDGIVHGIRWYQGVCGFNLAELERFAALFAAAERDRRAFEIAECYRCGWDSGANAERVECARACIAVGATKANSDDGLDIADLCAAAIRARGAQ